MSKEQEYCSVCGLGGLPHPQCEPTKESLELERNTEVLRLDEFSISGRYGACDNGHFSKALERFYSYFDSVPEFDLMAVIENKDWWYIPVINIGCIGYIVVKESGDVYLLGSGLSSIYHRDGYRGKWAALKAFVDGKVGSESLITNKSN